MVHILFLCNSRKFKLIYSDKASQCLEKRGITRGIIKENKETFDGGVGIFMTLSNGVSWMCTHVRWCTSIPNSVCRGIILIEGTWPGWKYLHHRNWKMLPQNQGFFLDS